MSNNYSVLMSLYIKEDDQWLVKSLESMLNQTVKPEQIVLVIDGPITDKLWAVVHKYQKLYPEILTVVPLDENKGLGKALNIGLDHCRNELVARMDTDDIALPTRCEKQLKAFREDPDLDIVGAQINEFYEDPNQIESSRQVPLSHLDIVDFSKRRMPFNHPTVMYKKSSVIEHGGYGKIIRKEDITLFSRMVNEGAKAMNLDEALVLYRSDEDNYKRRKNWLNVSSYIKAQYEIYKRGNCSMIDLIYVITGQLVMFISPVALLKYLNHKYLRQSPQKN